MTTITTTPTEIIEEPPYYNGRQWLGGMIGEISQNPLDLFERLLPQHPDIVRSRMGPMPAYIIFNADYAKHILQKNHANYTRPNVFSNLLHTIADVNLFSAEGDYWQRQRKMLSPAFHRQQIVGFGQVMQEETAALLARWQTAVAPLDIQHEMTNLTLNIVGRSLFGVDMLADSRGRELTKGFEGTTGWINYRFNHLLAPPVWVPIKANRQLKAGRATVERVSQQILDDRRQSGESRHDFLQMLIDLRYEDTDEGMDDATIRNEMGTFFFAGHETTSNTLSWAWYLLSQNPDAEAKLHEEVDAVLNGRIATIDDISHLPYTRNVINETMRLYPAAWATSRQPSSDDQVGPYKLPAGSNIFLAFYAIHRHPRYWHNPNAFDPDRFTPERAANRPNHAFMPFGIGPRFCIGSQFALTEATIALASIAARYRLRLAPGAHVEPETVFTLRVKDALPMMVEKRLS